MGKIKHYFDFVSSGHGLKELLEDPQGFRDADFGIEKEDGRIAVDIYYAGADKSLTITDNMFFPFREMIYNYDKFYTEAEVLYKIDFGDGEKYLVGQVDMSTAEYNGIDTFTFKIYDKNSRNLLKRNKGVNVNIFSPKDIYGNPIEPCQPQYMMLFNKPEVLYSKWKAALVLNEFGASAIKIPGTSSPTTVTTNLGLNPSFAIDGIGTLKDTLSFLSPSYVINNAGIPNIENFVYFEAQENYRNVFVEITGVNLRVTPVKQDLFGGIISATGYTRLTLRTGFSIENSTPKYLHAKQFANNETGTHVFPENYKVGPLNFKRGERLYIYNENRVIVNFNSNNVLANYSLSNTFSAMNVKISGTLVGYNTVVPVVRLLDVLRYVVKSSSGLELTAPRWEYGGEFYNQYIATAPLLRNLTDREFNLTFEEIVKDYLPEVMGDYAIRKNDTVFIGRYPDFYKDVMIADLTGTIQGMPNQVEGYMQYMNEKYKANVVNFKYENYVSKKETEEKNSYDVVHGEAQAHLKLKGVSMKKDVTIGFIRDAFMLAQQQRNAYNLAEKTATQDDGKKFLIDVVPNTTTFTFTETSLLRHNANDGILYLNNDSSFSWVLLGIKPGENFYIQSGNNYNSLPYIVSNVSDVILELQPPGSIQDVSSENTTYRYMVSGITIRNRRNEGFSIINNIEEGNNYANLMFTLKRVIINYYSQYLATCNLYNQDKPVNITGYLNNPDAVTQLQGDNAITEGAQFLPSNAILEPKMHKVKFSYSLMQFMKLQEDISEKNGWVSFYNPEGIVLKGYISKAVWTADNSGMKPNEISGTVEAELEEMYQSYYLEIFGEGGGYITLNGKATPDFSWSVDGFGNVSIFDDTGKRMFPAVKYNKIKVNNAVGATSTSQIIQWLQVLK